MDALLIDIAMSCHQNNLPMQLPALAPDHSRMEYILIVSGADVAPTQSCNPWHFKYLPEQQESTHVESKQCLEEQERKQGPK